jgi:zinc protease
MPQLQRPFLALLFATLLALSLSVHAALPQGVKHVTAVEGVSEYRLNNGLRVLLLPDNAKPLVTVNMVSLVGSRHEGPGEGGMAHLLEHLVFKGTPEIPDPKSEFVRRGMQWNGTTSYDRTNYYATFSTDDDSGNLDWYIGWLADSMVNSFIAQRDLDSEMTVVRNEFERAEVSASRVLYQSVLASAYHWHPYGRAVIGARSDIENVSITSLQRFYRYYYQPDNAVLVVAGKIDEDAVLERIAATLGKLPKPTRSLKPSYTQEPVQQGERRILVRRVGSVPMLAVAYHAAPGGSKAYAAQAVLRQLLTDAPSGRLHKALVESGLATGVSDWTPQTADPGFIYLVAPLADNAHAERAQEVLLDTLESMKPITEEEVKRAKLLIRNSINRTLRNANATGMSLTDSIASGDWRLHFAMRDWIEEVTVADVEEQARAYFVASNRTLGRFIPTAQPVRAPLTERVDLSALLNDYKGRDSAAAIDEFEMSNLAIEARTVKSVLPGGMKLAFLPRPTRGDRVTGTLRLHWGTLESLSGKRVDAMLLSQMMLKGTTTLSRAQLNDRLAELDSVLSVDGGLTGVTADFSAPKENLPQVIALLADVLRNPVFPESDFEQARRAFITGNESSQSSPAAMASNALTRHLVRYPDEDPRSALSLPEWQDLAKAATRERMEAFYRQFAGASDSELAMVGPIDAAQVTEQLRAAFDDWRSLQDYRRIERPMQTVPATRLVIEMPDKANAYYTAAMPLPLNQDDPDVAALSAAVHLLGGRAGTRLWNRLREQEGISYGVYATMNVGMRDRNGSIGISGSLAPENRERFETAVREELDKALKDGFSAAEVEFAQQSILRSRRQYITQEGAVADLLAGNLYWGRTLERREQRDREYAGLTAEQVNAALRKYLDPAKFSAAIAGDFFKK